MSPSRADLEASVQATASSIDGRRFVFQRSAHDLDIEVGGYAAIGDSHLGQVYELGYAWIEGAELTAALPGSSATDVRIAVVRGSGVVLDAESTPFHDVPIARATTSVVERHLAERKPPGAGLDVGAMLLEPELRVSLDASGFDRHTFFCGQSGSGKTYALGTVLERLLLDTNLRIVVLDPNSDFVRLGEVREGADSAVADRYREAAAGLVVRRSADTGSERLHVRFTDCDAEEQAAVLRLDPIADREEYGALVDLLDSGREAAPSSVGDLASRLLDAPDPATQALGARIRNLGLHRWPIWSVGDTGSVQDLVQPGGPRVAIVDLGSLQTPGEKAIAAESVLAALWRRRSVREPILIVIDEAHNVCPREPDDPVTALASAHAARIAAEGRKFGLYLLVSTQRPQRVNELVVSQCDNLVLMRMISASDLAHVRELLAVAPAPLVERAASLPRRRVARRGEDRLASDVRPLRPAGVRGGRRGRAHIVGARILGLSQPTSGSAAASISSSDTRTSRAASPSGTNESLLATRATSALEAGVDELRDHALGDAARAPRLVHDEDAPGHVRLADDVVDRKRREPAQVDDRAHGCPARSASRCATFADRCRPFAHVTIVRSVPSPTTCAPSRRGRARRTSGADPAVVALRQRRPACGRARSARGRRRRSRPTSADSAHVTSIAAASSGRAGDATTTPGMSRSTPTASSLWKCPPKPRW